MLADDLVRDRSARHRNRDHAPTRAVDRLADGLRDFVRLAGREPDATLSIAHRDERVEREAASALDDLGDAIDRDDVLDELASALVTCHRDHRRVRRGRHRVRHVRPGHHPARRPARHGPDRHDHRAATALSATATSATAAWAAASTTTAAAAVRRLRRRRVSRRR